MMVLLFTINDSERHMSTPSDIAHKMSLATVGQADCWPHTIFFLSQDKTKVLANATSDHQDDNQVKDNNLEHTTWIMPRKI